MGVTTRIRDRGCFEEKSNSPVFCVEVPWCSGSITPIAYDGIIPDNTSSLPPRRKIITNPKNFAASDSPAGTNLSLVSQAVTGAYSTVVVNEFGIVTSGTSVSAIAPGTIYAGPSSGSFGTASFIPFTTVQSQAVTTPVDPNDIYFGTITPAAYLAAYNTSALAFTPSVTPVAEGASFSGNNVRIGSFTRKVGVAPLGVMGIQVAASASLYVIGTGILTGSARANDYLELESYIGANPDPGVILYGLVFGNVSGSGVDFSNCVLAQMGSVAEDKWDSACAIFEGGLPLATHATSGSSVPYTRLGIERSGTTFTVFAGDGVSKKVVLQTSSSITPTAWALITQTTLTPNPVWYLRALTRNTSATAST